MYKPPSYATKNYIFFLQISKHNGTFIFLHMKVGGQFGGAKPSLESCGVNSGACPHGYSQQKPREVK